ncbi:MAG: hypothetical protein JW951_05420 [Lentisphaerae bacterium]|nr:hypothetical protein [Lentisphaerota bacterium]
MRSEQFELCCEVLRRLDREGVLKHVVLIGSWCLLAYEDFFSDVRYRPGIRTRDIDLLIPIPPRFDHEVDLEAVLHDRDFVISRKGRDGYMPKTWQKTVRKLLGELPFAEELAAVLP